MNSRYKIGDKVKISSKLESNMPFGVNIMMRRFCGKTVKIADVEWIGESYTYNNKIIHGLWCYYIQEDGKHWKWNEYMFSKSKTLLNE